MAIKVSDVQEVTPGFFSFEVESDSTVARLFEHVNSGELLKEDGWLEANKADVVSLLGIAEDDFVSTLKTIRTQLKKLLA